ncbi:ABC transporter substrate-binding protein [Actinoallomurus acanthiterrae]
MRKTRTSVLLTALIPIVAGCTVAGNAAEGSIRVVVGYQSKTINTVTAGTLLRSLGSFESRLAALGRRTGKKYTVVWQDYDTGAPITAQMIAGKIDIGSMGDYPLLINGSRSQAQGGDALTEMVSVTGYNLKGALNGVVVAPGSSARTLRDLKGQAVSASVGSAGHGTLVQAMRKYGLDAAHDVRIENQQPPVGTSALQSGSVKALAQFVAWPGLLVQKGQARLLYDGGSLDVPTFHGVVVRKSFAGARPDVLKAFLQAQIDATRSLHAAPVKAAETVARATGLPPEVVYLYNGAGGVATFDLTIKAPLRAAFEHDVPFLKSIGVLQKPLDPTKFIDDTYLRQVYGGSYAADAASTANPAAITGTDAACHVPVKDPATAGEIWLNGEETTHPAADPVCLLRGIRAFQRVGRTVRAAYVPGAATGTRWFADKMVWVLDPAAAKDRRLIPFTTPEQARAYLAGHAGAKTVSYAEAVSAA